MERRRRDRSTRRGRGGHKGNGGEFLGVGNRKCVALHYALFVVRRISYTHSQFLETGDQRFGSIGDFTNVHRT